MLPGDGVTIFLATTSKQQLRHTTRLEWLSQHVVFVGNRPFSTRNFPPCIEFVQRHGTFDEYVVNIHKLDQLVVGRADAGDSSSDDDDDNWTEVVEKYLLDCRVFAHLVAAAHQDRDVSMYMPHGLHYREVNIPSEMCLLKLDDGRSVEHRDMFRIYGQHFGSGGQWICALTKTYSLFAGLFSTGVRVGTLDEMKQWHLAGMASQQMSDSQWRQVAYGHVEILRAFDFVQQHLSDYQIMCYCYTEGNVPTRFCCVGDPTTSSLLSRRRTRQQKNIDIDDVQTPEAALQPTSPTGVPSQLKAFRTWWQERYTDRRLGGWCLPVQSYSQGRLGPTGSRIASETLAPTFALDLADALSLVDPVYHMSQAIVQRRFKHTIGREFAIGRCGAPLHNARRFWRCLDSRQYYLQSFIKVTAATTPADNILLWWKVESHVAFVRHDRKGVLEVTRLSGLDEFLVAVSPAQLSTFFKKNNTCVHVPFHSLGAGILQRLGMHLVFPTDIMTRTGLCVGPH